MQMLQLQLTVTVSVYGAAAEIQGSGNRPEVHRQGSVVAAGETQKVQQGGVVIVERRSRCDLVSVSLVGKNLVGNGVTRGILEFGTVGRGDDGIDVARSAQNSQ